MRTDSNTFSLVTLGCPKNDVESEFIKNSLKEYGYQETKTEDAEIIIVNTCGFIQAAKEESIETILDLAGYKEKGCCRLLIVVGCLAQRYHKELCNELPEIDAIIGLSDHEDLPHYIPEMLKGKRVCKAGLLPTVFRERRARERPEGPSAYMQISDGCDNFCAYCAIPNIRGRYRSRSVRSLRSEAEYLVAHGVSEIVLIGQDTAFFGSDVDGEPHIKELLDELADLNELKWIRLLYCQPKNITKKFIEAVAANDKVCPYLDIPFQHASKRILQDMNRSGNAEQYLELIEYIRRQIPDIALRTSLIIGFPGETDQDFKDLLDFVEQARFDYIGLFEYSQEENTAAAAMPEQVPAEVVRERFRIISDIKDGLAFVKCSSSLGKNYRVLIEGSSDQQEGRAGDYFRGRSVYQAPDIDGEILVKKDGNYLKVGDIIEVKIIQADLYSFEGEPIV